MHLLRLCSLAASCQSCGLRVVHGCEVRLDLSGKCESLVRIYAVLLQAGPKALPRLQFVAALLRLSVHLLQYPTAAADDLSACTEAVQAVHLTSEVAVTNSSPLGLGCWAS